MFGGGNDKELAQAILGGGGDDEATEPSEPVSDEQAAAEDVMAAFETKDPAALASALKAFFLTVDAKPHKEGGE